MAKAASDMERSVQQGLAAFRWAAWGWMALVLLVSPGRLVRPWLAYLLVGSALVFTATCTLVWRRRPEVLLHPGMVATELGLGAALLVFDGLVRPGGTVFSTGQSLGSVWPLTGVISAGVALGPWGGAGAGVAMGLARYLSTVLNDVTDYGGGRGLSLASTLVFYATAGAVFGYVFVLLRRAREEVAAARAREDVARTLHDGVLQTLALVERRATDPALARLAREQERDLRSYLFGDRQAPPTDLGAALRAAAGRFEDIHGGRAQVLVTGDLPPLAPDRVEALAGAVGEALANAGKHAGGGRVVIYAEEAEPGQVFCSVKDDGPGFDAATTPEGIGLSRSIRGRVEGLGGRVVVATGPGQGTEIQLWL
ncbi:MAG TPA: ATP-binding protein [Acidimicrobiales bacterium]|nr:ATP-binding protein [Acidimicrobiales bacterium]